MSARRYEIWDVFTDRRFAGNPLAVLPDAEGLAAAEMQAIAAEFNLSETVFILPPRRAGDLARLRIFTPRSEIAFAGHPTVGAALALAAAGAVAPDAGGQARFTLEEEAGPVAVVVRFAGDIPVEAEFTAPQPARLGAQPDPTAVATILGLVPAQLATGMLPRFASCGTEFLFVEVRDLAALAGARCTGHPPEFGTGIFVATRDTGDPAIDWRARMFAPLFGVPEDPATGSAAAALAGLLAIDAAEPVGEYAWTILQGVEMGRPSLIRTGASKRGGDVVAVRVAGAAVRVARGEILPPDAGR